MLRRENSKWQAFNLSSVGDRTAVTVGRVTAVTSRLSHLPDVTLLRMLDTVTLHPTIEGHSGDAHGMRGGRHILAAGFELSAQLTGLGDFDRQVARDLGGRMKSKGFFMEIFRQITGHDLITTAHGGGELDHIA